jgi:hypothetical protein
MTMRTRYSLVCTYGHKRWLYFVAPERAMDLARRNKAGGLDRAPFVIRARAAPAGGGYCGAFISIPVMPTSIVSYN